MKILVIGSGGREHALVWKIAQSPLVEQIFCAPGNPGIGRLAVNVPLKVDDLDGLLDFAKTHRIDLTVVGPELPLSLGIVDRFEATGLLAFGVKGGLENGVKVIESAQFMSHLVNIGDTRTLISHPASTTHRQLDAEQQRAAGVLPDMIRISVGLEHIDDILADLDQALKAAQA